MGAIQYHRGIKFKIVSVGVGWWHWAICPLQSVKGIEAKSGQFFGTRSDAIKLAKREIERQEAATI